MRTIYEAVIVQFLWLSTNWDMDGEGGRERMAFEYLDPALPEGAHELLSCLFELDVCHL